MPTPGTTRIAAYCVCVDAGERLLLVRLNDRTADPGAWTLPGGGLDFGEHPEHGAIRELREETGLDGRIVELLTVDSFHRAEPMVLDGVVHEPHHGIRVFYRVEVVGGALRDEAPGNSTDRARWFRRDELGALRLVPVGHTGVRFAHGE